MGLLAVVLEVFAAVTALLAGASYVVVGPERIRRSVLTVRDRARAAAGPLAALAGVLVVNALVRDAGVDLSWLIGYNVTGVIYAVEGQFVAWLQSIAAPPLTAYFGYVYVYGYVFLLVFPVVAYLAADDPRYLKVTATAYVLNYAIGLVCYVLFIAYGPRNYMPDLVDALLYDALPRFQLLTSAVNTNVNVFPSLHASLAATVALLATWTRHLYPRWTPVAWVLATSVAISTMYLGIHWATDVVVGLVLAVLSVAVATRLYPETTPSRSPRGRR